ncbi:MAG: ABC transporter substrate-binding protein, partial [Chloroflexi bacterium]|nr:ABC transporter substrate-binding protein [Chloroflexota bacterium]
MIESVWRRAAAVLGVATVLAGAACGPRPAAPAATPLTPSATSAPAVTAAAPTAAPSPAPVAAAMPKSGGVLRYVVTSAPPHFDVQLTSNHAIHSTGGIFYLALLSYKMGPEVDSLKSEVVPELAESWEMPNDRTYIFHLRHGVKWHNVPPVNGREFVASDVLYTYKRLTTVEGRTFASYMDPLEKIEEIDPYTIKMTLKAPTPSWLSALAYGDMKIIAKEAVEAGGGNLKAGPYVGLGAFMPTKLD